MFKFLQSQSGQLDVDLGFTDSHAFGLWHWDGQSYLLSGSSWFVKHLPNFDVDEVEEGYIVSIVEVCQELASVRRKQNGMVFFRQSFAVGDRRPFLEKSL